jgi:hypothetical protein
MKQLVENCRKELEPEEGGDVCNSCKNSLPTAKFNARVKQ